MEYENDAAEGVFGIVFPSGDGGDGAKRGVHRVRGHALLKKDKANSMEVFDGYIHTYKFSEAIADEVVLNLIYEAREIDQRLGLAWPMGSCVSEEHYED